MPNANVSQPEDKDKQQRAVALRIAGHSYAEIARLLGWADESGARYAIRACQKRADNELVSDLRALEDQRLDKLFMAHWPHALTGDIESSKIILKIAEQRARLHGLNKPEKLIIAELGNLDDPAFADNATRLVAQLFGLSDRGGEVIDAEVIPTTPSLPPGNVDDDDWINP